MYKNIEELRIELRRLKKDLTYQQIADKFTNAEKMCNKGLVWKIMNVETYEPQDEELRDMFGLPERIVIEAVRDSKGRFS